MSEQLLNRWRPVIAYNGDNLVISEEDFIKFAIELDEIEQSVSEFHGVIPKRYPGTDLLIPNITEKTKNGYDAIGFKYTMIEEITRLRKKYGN